MTQLGKPFLIFNIFRHLCKDQKKIISAIGLIFDSLILLIYWFFVVFTKKIKDIVSDIKNPPSIYLLFGDLSNKEMNDLYNHPKIKLMVSLTKGEGFGRPLLEFTMTGKPVIASNWSGHKDFLPMDKAVMIGGKLVEVDESATNDFILFSDTNNFIDATANATGAASGDQVNLTLSAAQDPPIEVGMFIYNTATPPDSLARRS